MLKNGTYTQQKKVAERFSGSTKCYSIVFKRMSSGISDLSVQDETRKPLGRNTEHLCDPAITKMS